MIEALEEAAVSVLEQFLAFCLYGIVARNALFRKDRLVWMYSERRGGPAKSVGALEGIDQVARR